MDNNIREKILKLGIDIGSTSIKTVLCDFSNTIIFSDYRRHNTNITESLSEILSQLILQTNDTFVLTGLSGSIGMGISEKLSIPYLQEMVASTNVIHRLYPEVKTLVDIGGEDSKIIFFNQKHVPDIRMNGSCAGGTGAFIDQASSLLNIELKDFDSLAQKAERTYPIASRCGVYSKNDIQNLLSRGIKKEEIAASVLESISRQIISSLSHGTDILPKIFLCGGPFAFIPSLKKYFLSLIGLSENDAILPENAQLITAYGTALSIKHDSPIKLSELQKRFVNTTNKISRSSSSLEPLFHNETDYIKWLNHKKIFHVPRTSLNFSSSSEKYFLGIDSGSTTTKIVILDEFGNLVWSSYSSNHGDALGTFHEMLYEFKQHFLYPEKVYILNSCVTGYGEQLLKTTFNLNNSIVETMAHFISAQKIMPDVSFILDIGGQDMKAIFCENGHIRRIELNEACSSGCGSFIEHFAHSLGYNINEFAKMACFAPHPYDLGSRCTVFMNSKVKQAMREGATPSDIAAGFSYSVIKNCFYKLLKITNNIELGNKIVVQGGIFKNHSIVRALEKHLKKEVFFSDIPEFMGAYGCALYALRNTSDSPQSLDRIFQNNNFTEEKLICNGCENHCKITKRFFQNRGFFYFGNNCEKIYSNYNNENNQKGVNLISEKYTLLFNRCNNTQTLKNNIKIGIPRGLGIYEHYPFWHTLFEHSGFDVILSSPSSIKLYEKGLKYVMSDNICFPAKLMHGHIFDLVDKNVDRIFYPYIVYEKKEDSNAVNCYNCPIVTGYSDVLVSSMGQIIPSKTSFDTPIFSFSDEKLLKKSCHKYLLSLGIKTSIIKDAFSAAINTQNDIDQLIFSRSEEILNNAQAQNRMIVLLAGRPYHIDPLIEHKISYIFSQMGIDVITEDVARIKGASVYQNINTISQWTNSNRILKSAWFVGEHSYPKLQMVMLTSFGCGPDSLIISEVEKILRSFGKTLLLLKVDDMTSLGSIRLRIRSFIESTMSLPNIMTRPILHPQFKTTKLYELDDYKRKIIVPYLAEGYSEFMEPLLKLMGYTIIQLPQPCQDDVNEGLKYINNDICYPAIVVIGSIMRFLKNTRFSHNELAVIMFQTGGQCRATNYLSLIKNALVTENFFNIPVISFAMRRGLEYIPQNFTLPWVKYAKLILHTLLFADSLNKLYHSSIVRVNCKDLVKALRVKYVQDAIQLISKNDSSGLLKLAKCAALDFRNIIITNHEIPAIGMVGEIYVKYNNFANKEILPWIESEGIEVVRPPLYNFFVAALINMHISHSLYVKQKTMPLWLIDLLHWRIHHYANLFNEVCSIFPYWHPFINTVEISNKAKNVISLAANFGEGWQLPAEIINFYEMGIHNVISVQPFGCIANHIISKGLEKRIKALYPDLNLLFLDFDSNTSETNIYNRLHFIIDNSKKDIPKA